MSGRRWLLLVVLAVLLVRAAELRLPELSRPFWEDEIHHNEPVLASADMAALEHNDMYLAMFQPELDFWLRKRVWFPLLGVNERALRMPAMAFGLALIGLLFALAWGWARTQIRFAGALCFAVGVTLWAVFNPVAVHQSAEGRHYAFVLFASAAWCWAVLVPEQSRPFATAAAALLFANTHYFSLPLIALGWTWLVLRDARAGRWSALAIHLLSAALVAFCTRVVNRGPLDLLLQTPPGDIGVRSASLTGLLSRRALLSTWQVWRDYGRALSLPGGALVFFPLATVLLLVARRARRWAALLTAVWLVVPALFAYMRFRSNYDFEPRYFLPFFGFAPVLLVATFDAALTLWRRRPPSPRSIPIVTACAAVALTIATGPVSLVRQFGALRLPPANFSSLYKTAVDIRGEGKLTFIVHHHCFAGDMHAIYYERFLPPPRNPIIWSNFRGCEGPPGRAKARLDEFLAGPGERLVVLDDKEHDCAGLEPPTSGPVVIERVAGTTSCVWKLRGVSSRQSVAEVAAAVHFPYAHLLR